MEVPFLDLKTQYRGIEQEIKEAIHSVFDSGIFVGGKSVSAFEESFARYYNTKNCVALGNGTDALFAMMKSLNLKPGDEVITPAWSWISTAETISMAGGKPVFADVDPQYFTVNPSSLLPRITPRTKAILVVHLYGQAAPVEAISDLCRQHNLVLLEDCSQAHLTEENGVCVGKFGKAAAFSFYPTKNLGAYGDAGCVISDDFVISTFVRRFANHGGLTKDEHLFEGINSRMDPVQAAVLQVKLKYLSDWTQKRIGNATIYNDNLKGLEGITLPSARVNTRHTYHAFVIRTKKRDDLRKFLLESGIQTMIHYPQALPFEPAYQYLNHKPEDFPISCRLAKEVLSLPVYPELSQSQIGFVTESIMKFYGG